MNFAKEFTEIAQKNDLTYRYQEFENCFACKCFVCTHSLYNDSGCFTIHCIPQRAEVDCYYTEKFSTDRKKLCGKVINVFEVKKEIWNKNEKVWIFKNPLFYSNPEKIIKTLLEIINTLIEEQGEFFGVKIQ